MPVMRYGYAYDAGDELLGVSESSMPCILKRFCKAISEKFAPECLREPTEEDMKGILAVNESRGFPGCLGSIDCQHWEWEKCHVAWAGQFMGKGKKPTIAIEAISDGELWFWHLSIGHPGSLNDLNILSNSTTIERILLGQFPPRIAHVINGKIRDLPYYLAAGIYPSWPIFVKSTKGCTERKLKNFSQEQEAVREDVERAFGALVASFHVLKSQCRMWCKAHAMDILRTCVILHNMNREARRDNYNVNLYARATSGEPFVSARQFAPDAEVNFKWENADSISPTAVLGTWGALAARRRLESDNSVAYDQLRVDLVEHINCWKFSIASAGLTL
ncbi:unnamed protein product [Chondrus crispus]|uniref:DDE Tnp4 domain-containing protein n=1 Tax=Chondrus crispus TaxID=2769 RepID=R7Q3X7_CHOCR|nr:unnamed protein product [Chondrus crispus]CDF32185.1 unnamed protein product [Chondrus crispus]|eukprot:XP_005711850.1 unnamed protein product [Chondrus crispus]